MIIIMSACYNFLPSCERYLAAAGGVTIADEVQTGYARMGSHFCAFQKEQVRPQIVTLAKAIGNGHPVGILITTEEIAESFAATGVSYFNTVSTSQLYGLLVFNLKLW